VLNITFWWNQCHQIPKSLCCFLAAMVQIKQLAPQASFDLDYSNAEMLCQISHQLLVI
jgi:hypothetical protein